MDQAAAVPRSPFRRFALRLLSLAGWSHVLVWPPAPRGVIIVYPHTSNWDFIVGVLFRIGYRLKANWVGKEEMFPWPFRGLLERIGGIPLDRSRTAGFIEALLAEYRRRDWMWLAIAPEGTRSHTDHLKSGFYFLAVAGKLPVGLGYIDYREKKVGIDTYLYMTGDREADLAKIRDFYATKRGHRQELAGDIRFRK
jgi:1-acyl-sn-glycerol-3-phosphate acyltransferase